MQNPKAAQRALFVLLLGSMVLVALVLRPLAVALVLAAVLAGVLWPTQNRLSRALGGRQKIAAGILMIAVLLLLIGPIFGFSAFVVREGAEAVQFVSEVVRSEGVEGLVSRLPEQLEGWVRSGLSRIPAGDPGELGERVQQQVVSPSAGGGAAAAVGSVIVTTGSLVFQAVMMLIALFFFLTQKDAALAWIDEASPLRRGQTRELLAEFRKVSGAVVRSSVLTALVQATAAFVGYLIVRVPHPIFFAAVTFFVALIPAVGAASVVLLAALIMFLTGHPVSAIFLAIWGVLVVGLADNVVKPLLIKGGVQMHGAVVFFSLLGGLAAFGTIGLLLGPLAVSFFIALLRIYRRDYGDKDPPGRGRPPGRKEADRILRGGPTPQEA